MRLALASTVMLYHFGCLDVWPQSGVFAVQVFFALSGWLIGGILLRTSPAELPRFYFDRVVRIWAPYYLALLFLVAASLLREPVTHKWLEFVAYKATFVWNLFGTQQLATFRDAMPLKGTGNHFWSVDAEEQFYLLAPWLLVLVPPRFGRNPLTWLVVAIALCAFQLYGAIALGVLAAVLHHHVPRFHLRPAVRVALLLVVVGCAIAFQSPEAYDNLAPLAGVAIVLLAAVEGRRQRVAAFLGGLSYPLYLNHWIGGFLATVALKPFPVAHTKPAWVATAVLFSFALAAGLYQFIDRRMLDRRDRWATPRRDRLAMTASYALVAVGIALGLLLTRVLPR